MARPLFGGDNVLGVPDLLDIAEAEEETQAEGWPNNVYEARLFLRTATIGQLFAALSRREAESRAIAAQRFRAVTFPGNPEERRLLEEIGRRIARDLPRATVALVDVLNTLPVGTALVPFGRKAGSVAQPIQGAGQGFIGPIIGPGGGGSAGGSAQPGQVPGPGLRPRQGTLENVPMNEPNVIGPELLPRGVPSIRGKDDVIS